MNSIVLATGNAGKVGEIIAILTGIPLEIKTLRDFATLPEVVEDGTTLEENALKKARQVHLMTGLPALADDSGLEVFALNMRPGVHSARYAGERATYADNNALLLRELSRVAPENRRAQFRCVAALVGEGFQEVSEGVCSGTIAPHPRGMGGFGYDPLFIPDGFDKTFAELPIHTKNTMSHRAIAFRLMRSRLCDRLRISS